MATVHIPTLLQAFTMGARVVDVDGVNIRQIIDRLEQLYPGIKAKLVLDDKIAPNLSVSVDGDLATIGILEKVEPDSDVMFLPAIGGG